MTGERRLSLSPTVAVVAVLSILLTGVGGTYLIMRPGRSPARTQAMPSAAGSAPAPSAATGRVAPARIESATSPRTDIVVTLARDAAQRAGIEVSAVRTPAGADHVRLPGVVEPNAYRQV